MADDAEVFKLPECFLPTSVAPGDIILRTTSANKQVVEFFCHAGILYYNSDYFKTLLSGEWRENQVRLLFCNAGKPVNRGTEGDNGNTSADANVNANANANADANASTHIAAAVPPPPHLFDATRAPILVIRATIELLDETPETVLQILNHLYPHLALQLSPANWQPVWRLADKLGLTALSALCTEYMQDNILHVDPLAVVTWAKRTSQAEWYRKSSEIILDRMASSDALTLETLPRSLHVDLLNEFAYLAHNLHKFTSQGTQIIAETATYTGVRHAWHNAVKEASANPTTMSRESLLEVAASVPQAVSPRLATLVEKFRPFIGRRGLKLKDGDCQEGNNGGEGDGEDGSEDDGFGLTAFFGDQ